MLRCGIGKVNLEQADVVHNWGRNARDNEQHGGSQQQERADVVKEAGNRHFDICLLRSWESDTNCDAAQRRLLKWSTECYY